MRQFGFTTNIEHRMPDTGKVFMIDRMTSDWAECHPLNVDQLIEDVYQEFAGTEFEESREDLRKVWTATLSVKRPQGDANIYPNANGARRAAAMKVWHKAGDYWRMGFRMGDVLPERCPSHTITRLPDGGWISLFPKDMHLLDDESTLPKIDDFDKDPSLELNLDFAAMNDEAAETAVCEAEVKTEPVAPTLSHQAHQTLQPTERERNAERRRQRRAARAAQRRTYEERLEQEAREAEAYAREQERRKTYAAVGAVAVTLAMIYFFGLLGPAVFGLLCGGLLKG